VQKKKKGGIEKCTTKMKQNEKKKTK